MIIGLLGILAAFLLLRYREQVGDTIGEGDWMHALGGVYGVVTFVALIVFLTSIATMTGTIGFLFAPLRWLFPGLGGGMM